ncbi:MAG: recombinase family protein [Firmicutes bacterium]|nr:recombinase family protein [Bacillota bacterium]
MPPDIQCAAIGSGCRKDEAEMNKKVTILYERLSRDDELQGPSNSILNQRQLLEEYAERNELAPYIHICDDGWSGTRWDRPGWQELIAKVEADEVACICIKDGSRLGRDYLRVGLYRELFRERGVRLIAVNDNYDSERSDDEFTPFREIMAEWYARDTSKKIKSVFAAKGRSGKPISGTPPYGYVKDPNDKNKWLVDPEAAAVVRRIFQMTMDGMGVYKIAGTLAAEKIERPSYYLGSRGRGQHKTNYDHDHRYTWGDATIVSILRRQEYLGHTVNFRTSSKDFKSKKNQNNPPEKWLIFPNTHEAIIDQETFDTVQKLRQTPRRIDHLGAANPLTGLLWCADCGAKLYNHRKAHMQKPTYTKLCDVYHCSTYKLSKSKFNTQCTSHYISSEAARKIILEAIRATSGYVREHEQEFIERVREAFAVKQGEAAKTFQKQIEKNGRRLTELDRIYKSLYEDKALGKIGEDIFDQMTAGYQQERIDLRAKTDALQAELDTFNNDSARADKFIEIVRRYTSFEELTPAMLNEYVDKVIVHEGEWSEGATGEGGRKRGSRTQRVDVYLKYIGSFDVPDTRTPEQIEADRIAEEKLEARRAYHRRKTREHLKRKRAAEANPRPAELVPVM